MCRQTHIVRGILVGSALQEHSHTVKAQRIRGMNKRRVAVLVLAIWRNKLIKNHQ